MFDKLFIFQICCIVVCFILLIILVISRSFIRYPSHRYEVSRWHLVLAMFYLIVHYSLQLIFGFRARLGDDVGAVVNIFFYSPAAMLISYALVNISVSNMHRNRYIFLQVVSIVFILAAFFAGYFTYHSMHIGSYLFAMRVFYSLALILSLIEPLEETFRSKQAVERDTAVNLAFYDSCKKAGTILLLIIYVFVCIFLSSRTLIFAIGPLVLFSLVLFILIFVFLGFNIGSIMDALDAQLLNEKSSAVVQDAVPAGTTSSSAVLPSSGQTQREELSQSDMLAISSAINTWYTQGGYSNPDTSLDKLSHIIGQSSRKISLYLMTKYGCTFRVWLSNLRLREAKRMLVEKPDDKIEVIAEDCGFTSRSYFQNLFKAETGFTPREWRLNNRKTNS